ncbi:MAG TPA: phospholipase A [Verrucomicrobiae bacterium]|nr:phospholipase A [Verrucomicrobiae bacterium]
MIKIASCWKVHVLTLAVLCLTPLARGEDATLTLTMASKSVTAGDRMSVWLNALNASSNEISWTFPQKIESKIISLQGTFDGSLELRSAESNTVTIAPDAFVRREYLFSVPDSVTGQVVMEFPKLNVNRTALDVQPPATGAGAPKKKSDSVFTQFVKEVEPEEPDKGYEPGRFFKEHISGYEPMYFIVGPESLNAKFQISFAYQLLNNDGPLGIKVPALKGFHLAYTQVSLWDLKAASAPFLDTSYKPEFFYSWENVTRAKPSDWIQLDLQGGLKHESNGKDGADSRSLNIAYFRPTFTIGRDEGFQLTLQPRVWTYLSDLSDNPDIADYRGYADLRAVIGWNRGLQLSAFGKMGKDGNHRSVQLDLTYPMRRFFGSFTLYLDVQYFTGYGESLLGYKNRSDELRVGLALFR